MELKYKWLNSINQISKDSWEEIYNSTSVVKSYEFTQAVEFSKMEDLEYFYLLVEVDNKVCAIVPCFTYYLKLEILANQAIKAITNKVRKIIPGFFRTKIFVIGSPVATCENHLGLSSKIIDNSLLKQIGELIFEQVKIKSSQKKASLIAVKEIPNCELNKMKSLFNDNLYIFESLANSFVPIFKDDFPYPSMLRSRYKERHKYALRESDNENYTWEVVRDYAPLTKDMHRLYQNVYNKSKYKFEKLTIEFFENLNKYLPDNSYILTCKDKNGNLVCTELIIDDNENFVPMYMGLEYSVTENSRIYYNVIFRSIAEAEKRGKHFVILGQTSYYPKAYSGALFERLYIGFYSQKIITRFLMKNIFKYLFPKFKKPDVNNITEKVKNSGIFLEQLNKSKRIFE